MNKLFELINNRDHNIIEEDGEISIYLFLYFFDLEEFCEYVGEYWFDEGGLEIILHKDYVAIDIFEILESEDGVIAYKEAFSDIEYRIYKDFINNKE